MTTRIVLSAVAAASVILVAACTPPTPGPLAPQPEADISAIENAPGQSGERVYEGRVYSLDATRTAPLFRYDRRVRPAGSQFVSTHITHDPTGRVVVTQVAQHDSAYRVTSANLIQRQSGLAGSVKVDGTRLVFTLIENGKIATSIEKSGSPLVTGPTMFGFIVANWNDLVAGARVPMRFAVLERNRSIGFVLDTVPGKAGQTTIRMRPSSLLVRLAVGPTYFYFDPTTRNVIGYDGRVPPMENVDGELKTLDARVVYTLDTPRFR